MTTEPMIDAIEHRPVWERAYEMLRERILDGRLPAGTRLNLRDVAAQLGVSVTPTRDAALRLASEGLVETTEGRGLSVTQLAEGDIRDTLELRILLETYAVEHGGHRLTADAITRLEGILAEEDAVVMAAGTLDLRHYAALSQRFHHELIAATGHRVLLDLYDRLHAYVVMERAQQGFQNHRVIEDHREHVAILAALRRNAPQEASTILRQHLEHVAAYTLNRYRERQ